MNTKLFPIMALTCLTLVGCNAGSTDNGAIDQNLRGNSKPLSDAQGTAILSDRLITGKDSTTVGVWSCTYEDNVELTDFRFWQDSSGENLGGDGTLTLFTWVGNDGNNSIRGSVAGEVVVEMNSFDFQSYDNFTAIDSTAGADRPVSCVRSFDGTNNTGPFEAAFLDDLVNSDDRIWRCMSSETSTTQQDYLFREDYTGTYTDELGVSSITWEVTSEDSLHAVFNADTQYASLWWSSVFFTSDDSFTAMDLLLEMVNCTLAYPDYADQSSTEILGTDSSSGQSAPNDSSSSQSVSSDSSSSQSVSSDSSSSQSVSSDSSSSQSVSSDSSSSQSVSSDSSSSEVVSNSDSASSSSTTSGSTPSSSSASSSSIAGDTSESWNCSTPEGGDELSIQVEDDGDSSMFLNGDDKPIMSTSVLDPTSSEVTNDGSVDTSEEQHTIDVDGVTYTCFSSTEES